MLLKNETDQSIFHYTSLSTLLTILKEQKLRFSNRLYLNDSSEGKYVLNICLKNMNAIWPDESQYKKANLIEELTKLQQYISLDQFQVFQASFSLENDSLTMWNYYADGDGVNIEFSKNSLINSLKEHLHDNSLGNLAFRHGKVIYDPKKQVEILKELLLEYMRTVQYDNEWATFTSWAILNVGVFFKHPKFSCEHEYRIAYNILTDPISVSKCISLYRDNERNEPYSIDVYLKGGMLIPYIDIDIDFRKTSVQGIRTSPLLSSEYTNDGLNIALDKNGFDKSKVAVKKSEIPLRF